MTNPLPEPPVKKSRFPKKTFIWTLIVAVILFVLHWQSFELNERFNMNPGVPGIVTMALGFLTLVFWTCWAFFFSGRAWLGLLVLGIPVGFFVLYQPIFLGDANFGGLKPRFWAAEVKYVEPASGNTAALVDLTTTTPNDFPQFLGPNRDGIIGDPTETSDWRWPPELVWKIDVGDAWSGFVAVNGFAITQEQRGADECVTCYDIESGELKWIYRAKRRHEDPLAMGKIGPRATPVVDEGFVYVVGGTGVLDCLSGETGEVVWSVDVPSLVGIEQVPHTNSLGFDYTTESSALAWGRSTSPLIVDDLVVVPAGGIIDPDPEQGDVPPAATLIAFDKKTGQEKWRGGQRMIAYGSPTLATVDGTRQILLIAEDHAVGHDVETGEELWAHERPGNSGQDANCSQVTVVDGQRLIVSKGYGLGGELLRVTKSDDGSWNVLTLQKTKRALKTKFTNPIVLGGHTYSLSDGFLQCDEIETLKRKWKQRGRFGNGQILLVNDKLLVHSEFGKLIFVQPTPEKYTKLGSIETVDGICWNTICVYGDLVLVRSDKQAACFRFSLEEAQ